MSWDRGTRPRLLTIGDIEVPFEVEPHHFLPIGSTGTGKTITIDEMLCTVIDRGDRVIVCDPNGHHLSKFYRDGDAVMNAFDRRSLGWSIFNEVRKDFDCDRLARSIVPEGRGPDAQWHHYAQVLLSEVLRALLMKGECTTEALMHFAGTATRTELEQLLAGSPAMGLFDTDAARALASTRFILTTHLNAHKYVPQGAFSLRDWLEAGTGNLYLTWREDMHAALKPLITTWVEILANAMLSLTPHSSRRLWLVLDELGALGRLGSLEAVLTRGRKYGVCVVAGLQSTAQLDRLYGRDSSVVLRSCFRNTLVLGVARSDPDTADMLSRSLGEQEVEREQLSVSEGPAGITHSVTSVRSFERVVMSSELNELPDLTGFLALAGERPVAVIQLTPYELPKITAGIEE
ncbi:type IV secretion system DNA-binding domain-containing protein [Povalibacter sp.]|uniref:type IV secretion system DNA-binding domain-containing protein n=1 Tax=Povalibacter sp. TaxID=1962978 RepID=UPI002F3EBDDC